MTEIAKAQHTSDKTSNQRSILAACCSAHAIQDGLGAALYALLPVIAQSLGLNFTEIGLIRATKSGAMALFEMPSGIISESLGKRKLLVFGLLLSTIGCLSLSLSTALTLIITSVAIIGLGSAFQHSLSSAIITSTYKAPETRTALGLYNSSGDAGKLLFTGLFSLAVVFGLKWQNIIILFAIITFCFATGIFISFRWQKPDSANQTSSVAPASAAIKGWGIIRPSSFANLCLAVFLDTAVQSGFMVFVIFVIIEKGVPGEFASLSLFLTLIGGMFCKAVCGYLSQHLGIRKSFSIIQGATAFSIIALAVLPAIPAIMILPLIGIFLQGSTSITYASIADMVSPQRQSRGFGVIYTISSSAAIIGPVIFGQIGDNYSLTAIMMTMALVSLLAIIPAMKL